MGLIEESASTCSAFTVRERPVEGTVTATVGDLTIHSKAFVIETGERIELFDLTNHVMRFVRKLTIREGLVSLWSLHTTCAVFINECQVALSSDIRQFIEQIVERDA